MFEDATKFRRECAECRKQAAVAENSLSKAQWLLFADEWLKQALAAEALARREVAEPADAVAPRQALSRLSRLSPSA
ncbi:hypothetical protein ACT4MK_18230 [Bradyrhizobium barranii]|uniref:hypothetical protein n=1 Tax=Bradyrhizobium barranii TaxID=2992140 RepID=UPI004033BA41